MTIAVFKATLVVLYFMHLRWSGRLIWIFAGASILWLFLLIGLVMADVLTRPWDG
jgi:cytochrome c oxidase subunit 4